MKIEIETLRMNKMCPGFVMGRHKEGSYEKALEKIKTDSQSTLNSPVINTSSLQWTVLYDGDSKSLGYGTYGHICCAEILIRDNYDRYSFNLIFNLVQENETIEDKIHSLLKEVDWRTLSEKWDIGDL